jgi:hypothetical protein
MWVSFEKINTAFSLPFYQQFANKLQTENKK